MEPLRDVSDVNVAAFSLAIPADGKSSQVEQKGLDMGSDLESPIYPQVRKIPKRTASESKI